MLKDKRGSQFVEASLVLPLLFLIILSLIGLVQFYYAELQNRVDVHSELLEQASVSTHIYKKLESNNMVSLKVKGVYTGEEKEDYSGHLTVIDEGWMIRAGGVIDEGLS